MEDFAELTEADFDTPRLTLAEEPKPTVLAVAQKAETFVEKLT